MTSQKSTRGINPSSKKVLAFVAVAAFVAGACLVATQWGGDFEAKADVEFTVDTVKYKEISSKDLTVEVTGCMGSPIQLSIPDKVTHLDKTYSVVKIGKDAFKGNTNLASVSIGAYTTEIKENAFSDCKNLVNLDLKNVKKIGKRAFMNCTSLEDVVLPDSVEKPGDESFKGCDNIRTLSLPITIDMSKNNTFSDSKSIKTITLTKGSNGKGASYDYGGGNKNTPWYKSKALETLIIAEGVKSLGYSAFTDCDNIKNVVFPEGLETIDVNTFGGCKSIKSVILPDSLKKVDGCAFYLCTGIKEISVPVHLDTIEYGDDAAFAHCNNIEKVTLTKGNGDVHNYGYAGYKPWNYSKNNFKTLVVSEGVTGIGNRTFEGCDKLENVTFPSTLKTIGDYAFKDCSSLTNLTLPDNLTSIKHSAFEGCKSLDNLTIPDNVTKLGEAAFKDCKGLTRLTVPVSLNTVVKNDDPAFDGCKKIGTVTLTAGTGKGHGYDDNTYTPWHISKGSFKSLIVADGVKSIGKNSFKGCDNLRDIQFCDGLESIGKDAFNGFRFFDSDGVTELSIDAGHLKGCTFSGNKSAMVKQTA